MAFPLHSRLTRRSALQLVGATGLSVVGLPVMASHAALDTIDVAVVVDTSGAGGVYGAPVLKGMLLAATEINARGASTGTPWTSWSVMASPTWRASPRWYDTPAKIPPWSRWSDRL